MLEPGDAIDQWVVERPLGAGGMGSVYQCRSRSAARIRAAVKVLDARLDRSDAARKRFVREAEILYALDHPNIVRVQSVRLDFDPPHLTMEFVDGESLDHRLGRGAVPLDEAVRIMRQMADAIAHLHARGIRHRDLKPANVVVQADGTAKIVDFGIALEIDATRLTNEGARFGTPGYAPPEWLGADATDPAQWDLYALGVCFYELLTGAVAFPISSDLPPQQQILQVMLAKQARPHLDPGEPFPEPLRALVRELSSSNPADRPDAATVAARLRGVEAGATTVAPTSAVPTARDNSTLWEEPRAPEGPPSAAEAPTVASATPVETAPSRPEGVSPALLASPKRAPRGLAAAGAALAVALVGTVAAGAWIVLSGPPAPREVTIELRGADAAHVLVDGRAGEVTGSAHRFSALPVGAHTLRWAVGEGCDAGTCPSEPCPAWCGSGTSSFEIAPGEGPVVVPLEVAVLPRSVRLTAPTAATFMLAGAPGAPDGATASRFEVAPGRWEVVAEAGTCAPEARGCVARGDCPPGCTSLVDTVVVPWGEGEIAIALAVPDPEPVKAAAGAPRAVAAAPVARGARATGHVTMGAFARWLADHAEWSPSAAVAAGRADAAYLAGWSGGQPPPDTSAGPVTGVSWLAAAAYCETRGGLVPLHAEPLGWSDGDGPYIEWRVSDGRPAWRSMVGQASTAVSAQESNPMAGFRCAG